MDILVIIFLPGIANNYIHIQVVSGPFNCVSKRIIFIIASKENYKSTNNDIIQRQMDCGNKKHFAIILSRGDILVIIIFV